VSPQYDAAVANDDAVEMQGVDVVPSMSAGISKSSMLSGRPLMTLSDILVLPSWW